MVVHSGIWFSYPVFLPAIEAELGGTRAQISGVFSLFLVAYSLAGPWVGLLVDRLGAHRTVPAGAALMAAGLWCSGQAVAPWQLYVAFGTAIAIGSALAGLLSVYTVVNAWFPHRRGTAIGVVSSAVAVGMMVVVPAVRATIDRVGWRATYELLGAVVVAVMVPIGCLLRRPPRGAPVSTSAGAAPERASVVAEVKSARFVLLAAALASSWFVSQALLTHQVAALAQQRRPAADVAAALAVLGLASFAAKLGAGWAADRWGRRSVFVLGAGALAIALLAGSSLTPDDDLHLALGVALGIGHGAHTVLTAKTTGDLFAPAQFARVYGTLNLLYFSGGALGVWLAGWLFDRTGTYRLPFLLALPFCAASALAYLAIPRQALREAASGVSG